MADFPWGAAAWLNAPVPLVTVPRAPPGLRQRVLPAGHGTGRARVAVGAVSVQPCVSAVPPAGTLLLGAPLLPMLACDTVS